MGYGSFGGSGGGAIPGGELMYLICFHDNIF